METLRILSIDHGAHDLVPVAERLGADPRRLPDFKVLTVGALAALAQGRPGFGMFLDGALGARALTAAAATGVWVARQYPHGSPLQPSEELAAWPRGEVAKVILNGRPDARVPLAERWPEVSEIAAACRAQGRETLVEALPAPGTTTHDMIRALQDDGLAPDWWLVEAEADANGWRRLADVARRRPCRGLIAIARNTDVGGPFAVARTCSAVAGFVAGRSAFGPTLESWLAGNLDDAAAREDIARRFGRMVDLWDTAGRPS